MYGLFLEAIKWGKCMAREWTLLVNISWTSMDHLVMIWLDIALGFENLQLSGSKEFQMCNQFSETTQECADSMKWVFLELMCLFMSNCQPAIYRYQFTHTHIREIGHYLCWRRCLVVWSPVKHMLPSMWLCLSPGRKCGPRWSQLHQFLDQKLVGHRDKAEWFPGLAAVTKKKQKDWFFLGEKKHLWGFPFCKNEWKRNML